MDKILDVLIKLCDEIIRMECITPVDGYSENGPLEWETIRLWCIICIILVLITLLIITKRRIINVFSRHLLSCSLFVWLAGVIVYIIGFYHPGVNCLSVIPRAIIASFKMFALMHDLVRVPAFLQTDACYMLVFALTHFSAACLSFMFIFKMIGFKVKSKLRIYKKGVASLFKNNGELHLFWEVNEQSLLLAEDIKREYERYKVSQPVKPTIIFIDVDKECKDNLQLKLSLSRITNTMTITDGEICRLENIGAYVDHCYDGPASLSGNRSESSAKTKASKSNDSKDESEDLMKILRLDSIWKIVKRNRGKINFYFLSDDERENITGALRLYDDKGFKELKSSEKNIYVHARKNVKNEVFDHYSQFCNEAGKVKIKIVDSAYLAIEELKKNIKTLPVDCVKTDTNTGLVNESFKSLIVGFGDTGLEAFNFLYEHATFVGPDKKKTPFSCFAIDEKMNSMAGLIRTKMPAIKEDELTLIQATVDSEEFWINVRDIMPELNYVVVCMNDDEAGLALAVNLFKYALKTRTAEQPQLHIMLRCYDSSNEESMEKVVKNLREAVRHADGDLADGEPRIYVEIFGKKSDIYNSGNILQDKILSEAKQFHWVYEKTIAEKNNSKIEETPEMQWEKDFVDDGEMTAIDKAINKAKRNGEILLRYHAIYDINRKISQNISNTHHKQTKLHLLGLDGKDKNERLREMHDILATRKDKKTAYSSEYNELLQNIAILEHERWISSHKLMGFTYGPKTDMVKKQHPDMVHWSELSEEKQSYDSNVVDTTIKLEHEIR